MFVNGIHFQEYAKLEYGRMVWRLPAFRERLLRHWRNPRHLLDDYLPLATRWTIFDNRNQPPKRLADSASDGIESLRTLIGL